MATKIPKGALRFVDSECNAYAFANDEGNDEKLKMTVYSGKPITGHWYWGTLAIDVSGIEFNQKKFPVLEEHRNSKKIGFSKKPITENNSVEIDSDTFTFVDTEESKEFRKLSKEGFPYQSSIHAIPMSIERLEEGTSAEVNGYKLKGPAVIWRKSSYMEGSVAVFGWDSKTNASVFSKEEVEVDMEETLIKIEEEVIDEMKIETVDQLKKEYPEFVKEIETKLNKEIQDLTDEKSKMSKRLLGLEKKETIRAENEIKFTAKSIWKEKLAESNIDERLFNKVQKHVTHNDFVKDEIFDEEGFSKAIDDEIKDWESRGASKDVMGRSYRGKDVNTEQTQMAKENEDIIGDLLSLAGQNK